MRDTIASQDPQWRIPTEAITVDGLSWTPDLVSDDGAICHIHTVRTFARPWLTRIEAARRNERIVHVASPVQNWYSSATLTKFIEWDVCPLVLDVGQTGAWTAQKYDSVIDLVAFRNLQLERDLVKRISRMLLDRASTTPTSDAKGRRFEEFLVFLFSQVSYFKVFSHNYTNETEEIDVVLENRLVGEASLPPSPIVLVSAKNTEKPVGVPALTSLEAKMRNRRGMCKLGFLCAAKNVASTVATHELRGSREERVIVVLEGEALAALVDCEELDEALGRHVIDAALQ